MNSVLQVCDEFAVAYLDDIVVYSQTGGENLQYLRKVLTCLHTVNLILKTTKCHVTIGSVTYLGHLVDSGELRPLSAKTEAIRHCPEPKTQKQVRAFMGLASYYCLVMPNFEAGAAPLNELTSNRKPKLVEWAPVCQQTFDKLKDLLSKAPVLKVPDYDQPFIVQTEASNSAIGAGFTQKNEEWEEQPMAYISKKLLSAEPNYATVERECLEMVWTLRK